MTGKYMSITFTDSENRAVPMIYTQQDWTKHLADVILGVGRDEFDPAHTPRMVGYKNTAPAYEIQVTEAAAERIRKLAHPDVMLITEVVERPKFAFGAALPPEWIGKTAEEIRDMGKPKTPKDPKNG